MKVLALLIAACGLLFAGGARSQILNELANSPVSRFSPEDNRLFLAAIDKALSDNADGAPLAWQNDKTPARGNVTPQRSFESGGMRCRDLLIANRYGSRTSQSVHTFCRDAAGAWKLRS